MFVLCCGKVKCEVDAERDSRYPQAREASSIAIESCEWASVPPSLTIRVLATRLGLLDVRESHFRAHGSCAGRPAAAANLRGSKPVRVPLGGIVRSTESLVSLIGPHNFASGRAVAYNVARTKRMWLRE